MSIFAMFLLLFASLLCHAQTATCTNWKFFTNVWPSGINRWGTVVGYGSGQQSGAAIAGYVRYSNGAVKTYVAPNSATTNLARRNQLGVTVGSYRDVNNFSHGLLLSGSSTATVDYPYAIETILNGINYRNTMVGIFTDSEFPVDYYGFKLKDGVFTFLQ